VYSEKRNATGSFKGIERNYFVNASYRTSVSNDVGTLPPTSNKLIELEFDLAADLTLTGPIITGNLFAGNILTLNATIMNIGDFDLNTTEIPVRFLVDDKNLGLDEKLSKLGASENANVTKEWTATLGTHIINITVDPTDIIGEKNETNNLVTTILSISVSGPELGLSPGDITFDPTVPTKNTNMTVSARITNFGGYDPADNGDVVTVKFYLNDPLLSGTQIGTDQTIDSIPPTTTRTVDVNFTITIEGNYNIFVIVEAPYDSDLTNNKANQTLIIFTLPDLYISPSDISFIPSSKLIHDTPVFIRAVVHNIGGTSVDNVGVSFYDGDPDSGGVRIGFNTTIDPIEPNGGTVSAQIEWTPTTIGQHQIFVKIDPDGLLTEAKVVNNIANQTVNVLSKPNLRVEPLDIIFSSNPIMEGDPLNIQVLIHNDGDVSVDFVTVRVTLNALENTPIVPDIQIISIPANGYFNVPITWQTAEPNGTHTFYVRIDPDNKIPESNKLDNHAGRQLIITKTIDLVITDSDISINNDSSSNQLDFGKSVTVTARIWNEGGSPTVTDFIVQFFVSDETTDRQIGADMTISLIEPGSYADVSVNWFVNASGRHEITVIVDPSGLIFDSNRANNKAVKEVFVSGPPDLAVVVDENMFSTGGYAKAGEDLTISAFVQNRGETGWGPVIVSFHVGDPTDTANGSTMIGNPLIIAFLGPSDQVAVNKTWTAANEGEHEIYIAIDLAENVPDTNRGNNMVSGLVEVLKDAADFTVETIDTSPEEVKVGQPVSVNITLRNLGNIFVSGVQVNVYEYDETNEDNKIYNYTASNLPINGTHREQYIWNGTNLPSTYELIVVVDPYNDFKEFDESNNMRSIEIPVEPKVKDADLEFIPNSPIEILPLEPGEGDTVQITVYFHNIGGKTANNIVVTLTLSGVVLAKDQSVTSLASGDTDFVVLNWKPESEGSYLIKVELSSNDGGDSVSLDYVMEVSSGSSSSNSDNALVAAAIAVVVIIVVLVVFVLLLVGSRRRITEWAECSECSAKMPMEASICPTCGAEFSDEMECGECHSMISVDDSTCPNCGAVFIEDAEKDDKKKRGFLKFGEEQESEDAELIEPEADFEPEEAEKELEAEKVPPAPVVIAEKPIEEKKEEPSVDDDEPSLDKDEDEDIELKIEDEIKDESEIELDEDEFEEFEKALDSDHIDDMEPRGLLDGFGAVGDTGKKKKKKKKKKKGSGEDENGPGNENSSVNTNDLTGTENKNTGNNSVANSSDNANDKSKTSEDSTKTGDDSKDEKEDDFVIPEAQWTAECYKCNARIPLSASICPECGAEFE
jgi:subtilase family serine protease/RNA polymerase subunit RPABC4/transcription elongation factor Spt4